MSLLQTGIDALLALGLVWLAWRALACPDLFRGIVLFIAFGLLMALAWVRLEAPDVALAEAAIGAGLTGALLLAALARLNRIAPAGTRADTREAWRNAPALLLVLAGAGLGLAVLSLLPEPAGLQAQVAAELGRSGVSNPVTAVLLNFRGYDTLLEVLVLLLALLAAWSLEAEPPRREAAPGPVLDLLLRLLLPVLVLAAAYLLWAGAHAPGGAFQAGAVLGAAGVLALLAGWRLQPHLTGLPLRLAIVIGPGGFLLVAWALLLTGRPLLEYPPALAGALILLIETLATLSIAATLAVLFQGSRPAAEPPA
ncbi:MAG: sodium:proton antiporter [Gammaproteobacteria bacterium]|nr:sodium:proton antiporter [Gammaproteobacteria bacterium]